LQGGGFRFGEVVEGKVVLFGGDSQGKDGEFGLVSLAAWRSSLMTLVACETAAPR
jgi:hypothetical protein